MSSPSIPGIVWTYAQITGVTETLLLDVLKRTRDSVEIVKKDELGECALGIYSLWVLLTRRHKDQIALGGYSYDHDNRKLYRIVFKARSDGLRARRREMGL